MTYQLRLFLLAIQFFTRIPITGRLAAWVGFTPMMLRESAAYFPLVGACVGLVAGGVLWLSLELVGPAGYGTLIASTLSLIATLLMTGAFHEDGLADTFDGLGGSQQRDRALEIMKDSRVGTFGALALVGAVLLKVLLVAELSTPDEPDDAMALVVLLICAHTLSRASALSLIGWLTHVGDHAGSKSKPLADRIDQKTLWIALITGFIACSPLFSYFDAIFFIVFIVACIVSTYLLGRWFRSRLGGFTGDCLGATQQTSELAIYLCAATLLA